MPTPKMTLLDPSLDWPINQFRLDHVNRLSVFFTVLNRFCFILKIGHSLFFKFNLNIWTNFFELWTCFKLIYIYSICSFSAFPILPEIYRHFLHQEHFLTFSYLRKYHGFKFDYLPCTLDISNLAFLRQEIIDLQISFHIGPYCWKFECSV